MDKNTRIILTGMLLLGAAIVDAYFQIDVLSYLMIFLSGASFPVGSAAEVLNGKVSKASHKNR